MRHSAFLKDDDPVCKANMIRYGFQRALISGYIGIVCLPELVAMITVDLQRLTSPFGPKTAAETLRSVAGSRPVRTSSNIKTGSRE